MIRFADLKRWYVALSRPSGRRNARRLRARGEEIERIVLRDADEADVPELAALHVELWNATYRSRGPTPEVRARQWTQLFCRKDPREFLVIVESQSGHMIGFVLGRPHEGDFAGELAKIYLRWEYQRLGIGRRMMAEAARRFLERGIDSFILFAERSNPTIGFYDRMGGERLLDERGVFGGAYAWRDVRGLLRQRTSQARRKRWKFRFHLWDPGRSLNQERREDLG